MEQLAQYLRENMPKSFSSDIEKKPEAMHGCSTKKWERVG